MVRSNGESCISYRPQWECTPNKLQKAWTWIWPSSLCLVSADDRKGGGQAPVRHPLDLPGYGARAGLERYFPKQTQDDLCHETGQEGPVLST